jgi:hypothetical protein
VEHQADLEDPEEERHEHDHDEDEVDDSGAALTPT